MGNNIGAPQATITIAIMDVTMEIIFHIICLDFIVDSSDVEIFLTILIC